MPPLFIRLAFTGFALDLVIDALLVKELDEEGIFAILGDSDDTFLGRMIGWLLNGDDEDEDIFFFDQLKSNLFQ